MVIKQRKGFGMIKMIFTLLILGIVAGMGGFIYYGWQGADMSQISGHKGISKGQSSIGYIDIQRKVENALKANTEVTLTETELNQYLARNIKMNQGGFMKGFSSVEGVYVDLNGEIKTDVFQPFTHTISMKLKIYTVLGDEGVTTRKIEFPGGRIGKAPAPGLMVTVFKNSFDQIAEHFSNEIALGYEKMTSITVGDGVITLDPRIRTRVVTQ